VSRCQPMAFRVVLPYTLEVGGIISPSMGVREGGRGAPLQTEQAFNPGPNVARKWAQGCVTRVT